MKISTISAREILDSRGNPTVEAEVVLKDGSIGSAKVPSGASTGAHEALELRDGDEKRYMGKGVLKACENVNTTIREKLSGMDVDRLRVVDEAMIELDGTESKSKLGANAILSVSMATARAFSVSLGVPLYQFHAEQYNFSSGSFTLPVPMCNVLNGGKHADSGLDVQEFMICPVGAHNFHEGIRMAVELFHTLKGLLKDDGHIVAVGDEGGFAPKIKDSQEAYEYLLKSVEKAGYIPGEDIAFACDVASTEFYDKEKQLYLFEGEQRSRDEMFELYDAWMKQYPLISIEDPLDEDDWEGWTSFTKRFGSSVQVVGDDFLVTNAQRLNRAIEEKCANSILIKVNQIGTVTEAVDAIQMAYAADWTAFVSHRSGETADTFISDLAVASGCAQIKAGSLSRSDRVEKYNRLLQVEEELELQKMKHEYRWVK